MSSIFGGSKSKSKSQQTSTSYNKAYDPLLQAFQPLLDQAGRGYEAYDAFMGGDRTGFDNYLSNSAFNFEQGRGTDAINQNLASKGLRNSGSALKSLTQFNNQLQNQYSNNYLDRLREMMGMGTNAANILSGAGNYSHSQGTSSSSSKSSPGLGGLFGSILGGVAGG